MLDSTHTEKAKLIATMTSDEGVQFFWCIDFDIEDEEIHDKLLLKIIELFVTVRGFAFASAWVRNTSRHKKINAGFEESMQETVYR